MVSEDSVLVWESGSKLEKFNQQISLPITYSRKQQEQFIAEVTPEIYTGLYQILESEGVKIETIKEVLTMWTSGKSRQRESLKNAWQLVIEYSSNITLEAQALRALIVTRAQRWELLASYLQIPRPSAFRLYRGFDLMNQHFSSERRTEIVRDTVNDWCSGRTEPRVYPHSNLASWGLTLEATEPFRRTELGLIYQADIPFAATLADKWIDDSGFLLIPQELEVVVLNPRLGIEIQSRHIRVVFQNTVYNQSKVSHL